MTLPFHIGVGILATEIRKEKERNGKIGEMEVKRDLPTSDQLTCRNSFFVDFFYSIYSLFTFQVIFPFLDLPSPKVLKAL